ncbi:MAG: PKD domain-containing protein [Frankiaceae bacterium]|nr:PKD domain-containing protein [Frankiaceae bacterium]MBV9872064.1 PKD domain-containing protein [Frankiaceae bacterium]
MSRTLSLAGPAAALIAAAGLIAVPGSSARAASCSGSQAAIVVHLPGGGGSATVSTGDICRHADVLDTQYSTLATAGGTVDSNDPYIQQGLSVPALLSLVAADPSDVGFLALPSLSGGWSTLSKPGDFSDPSDFQDGLLPVFRVDGNVVDYYRPQRSPSDVNAPDYAQSGAGSPISVELHSGSLLTVHANANRLTIKPGTTVDFSADVSGVPDAARPLAYTWAFGDGNGGTGVIARHKFSDPGTYAAQATVTGQDDSAGISQPVVITVESTHHKPGGGPGPGGGGGHHPPGSGGSPHSGGHHPGHTKSPHPTPTPTPTGSSRGGFPPGLPVPLPDGAATGNIINPLTPTAQSPVLATEPPLVQGFLVGGGETLTAKQTATLATRVAATNPTPTEPVDKTGWAVAGFTIVAMLLAIGVVRELFSRTKVASTAVKR